MAEKNIERINSVLRTIRDVDQLIVRERDGSRLLQGICDNLVENRGYFNVWIVQLNEAGELVCAAESRVGEEFASILSLVKGGDLTECASKALKRPGAVLTEEPFESCHDCPLSEKCKGRAGITLRMEHESRIFGLLCVSIQKDLLQNKEEHELLEEIAGDIAFGLAGIEQEEKRRHTEESLRLTEKALRESEKNLRDLVDKSRTGISIVQDDREVYRNPEQDKILGEMPLLFTAYEHIHPEDIAKVKSFYQRLVSGEAPERGIDIRFYPSGNTGSLEDLRWVHCRANLIEYKGRVVILANLTDIKKTKELEQLLGMQDKLASLGRVAAGMAHEIRNPLSGINIYLNTLEKIYDDKGSLEKVKQIIEQLQAASRKIESVIKRVMDFAKPGELVLVSTSLNKPVQEAIDLSAVTLRKSGIRIEQALGVNLPPCNADLQLITQVVLNLISNASEAMKKVEVEKRVRITTFKEGDKVTISVSDSGPGVPSDLREKIFDPFYTTRDWSTGIGLSICKRIISDHRGSIRVVDSDLGGAEFRINIPVSRGKERK